MYWIPVGKVRIFMEGLQVYFSWQMQNSSSMPKFLCRAKYPSLCYVWNVVILNAHLNQELLEKHTRISHWTISPPCKFSLPSGMYMFTSSCLNFTKTLWGSYPPGHSSPRLAILLMTLGHQLRHSAWINDPRRKCTEYLWERFELFVKAVSSLFELTITKFFFQGRNCDAQDASYNVPVWK